MPRFLAACLILLISLCALPSRAENFPRVIFPEGHALTADAAGTVSVDVALLQIELRPGLVLAAERGTRFALAGNGDARAGHELRIIGGTLTVLDLHDNAVLRVPPGSYSLAPTAGNAGLAIAPLQAAQADQVATDGDVLSPGYRLSDAIMTQQQKYLDSLKIDVRDINSVLASLIRALVPRKP